MVEVHYRHPDSRVKEFLEGHSTLKSIEQEALGDVAGRRLLHLMCQFGLDTLSWARRGALVTGVDISDRSVDLANQLKSRAHLKAEFVRSDVLDLIGRIDRRFDIVYQSYGTHCWIRDLNQWARVIAHYLKPDGAFLMIDDHPIMPVFEDEGTTYFATQARVYSNAPDYCDRAYRVRNELVEWQHTLSDIVNALIKAGLEIEWLQEYDFSYYPVHEDWCEVPDRPGYWRPPGGPPPYPLMFSIRARKGS